MIQVVKGQFRTVQDFLEWESKADMFLGDSVDAYGLYMAAVIPTVRVAAIRQLMQEDKLSPVNNTILFDGAKYLLVCEGEGFNDYSVIDITRPVVSELVKANWFADFNSYYNHGEPLRAADVLSKVLFGHTGAVTLTQVQ
jgi:hypothetical protein